MMTTAACEAEDDVNRSAVPRHLLPWLTLAFAVLILLGG
jgi:hypothetical protein